VLKRERMAITSYELPESKTPGSSTMNATTKSRPNGDFA
jgi:hypothetical protein